jgi:hypothetical protein
MFAEIKHFRKLLAAVHGKTTPNADRECSGTKAFGHCRTLMKLELRFRFYQCLAGRPKVLLTDKITLTAKKMGTDVGAHNDRHSARICFS